MQVDWSDIKHLAEAYMESHPNVLMPSSRSRWYGILDGGEWVAFAHSFWRTPTTVSLNAVYVAPDHRGRGYHRSLLTERITDALRSGAERIICGFDEPWMGEYLEQWGFDLVEYGDGKLYAEMIIPETAMVD